MKKLHFPALALIIALVTTLLAGCNPATVPSDTTPPPTTPANTTPTPTTSEPVNSEPVNFDGYVFTLGNPRGLAIDYHQGTALGDEIKAIYEAIEEELNVVIEFAEMDVEYQSLLTYIMSGQKGADFINTRQLTWTPMAVRGYLRALDTQEMRDAGLELENEDCFNQYYTQMLKLNGHIWGFDVTGKFYRSNFAQVYAFNKRLVKEAGYEPEALFQAVREGKWDYSMFMEIARKITKDTDGDGVADIWGLATDGDGNEIWTNGTGPIVQDSSGKWIANLTDPRVLEAMTFMATICGDKTIFPLAGETVPTRKDHLSIFYEGKAGFAGLYGKDFGPDGTFKAIDPIGLLPIPKGPDANEYRLNISDAGAFVTLISNEDWEKSAKIMNEMARGTYDPGEYRAYIEESLQYDADSIEILFNYLLPNLKMIDAKCSREMYTIVRDELIDEICRGNISPAAAAEKYQNRIQAELDNVFNQQ